jgi:hypothetical protein
MFAGGPECFSGDWIYRSVDLYRLSDFGTDDVEYTRLQDEIVYTERGVQIKLHKYDVQSIVEIGDADDACYSLEVEGIGTLTTKLSDYRYLDLEVKFPELYSIVILGRHKYWGEGKTVGMLMLTGDETPLKVPTDDIIGLPKVSSQWPAKPPELLYIH